MIFLRTVHLFIDPNKLCRCYMDNSYLHKKNESYIEMKTSQENSWQRTIQSSDYSQHLLVLREEWYSFTYKSIHDEAVGMRDLDVMLPWSFVAVWTLNNMSLLKTFFSGSRLNIQIPFY